MASVKYSSAVRVTRGRVIASVIAVAAGLAFQTGLASAAPDTGDSAQAEITVIAALQKSILEEFSRLSCATSTEDLEAAIVFRVSQSGASDQAAIDALQGIRARPNLCPTMGTAVDNVISTLRRKALRRGTAAIDGGGDVFFTTPAAPSGAGQSNYRSAN